MDHAKLIQAIRDRKSTEQFGYGITTADRYVKQIYHDCPNLVGLEHLEKRASVLTYCDSEMLADEIRNEKAVSTRAMKDLVPEGWTLPEKTIMVIRHILTSTKEDRDGDVLEASGAVLDPRAPLLWQHMQAFPIGKVLGISDRTKEFVKVVVALVDAEINGLRTTDVATLFEADILRFSHGFQVKDFEERQNGGYHIKSFEVLEDSGVSVPSNTDSVADVIATQKFESDVARKWVKSLLPPKKPQVQGVDFNAGQVVLNNCEIKQLSLGGGSPRETVKDQSGQKPTFAIKSIKGFNVAQEQLEASKLEYDWASRYLGCEIKDLMVVGTMVPDIRKGSYFSGEHEILGSSKKEDQRRITRDGKEQPLLHETIQLNSKSSGTFMTDGMEFWKRDDGTKLIVKHEESWGGNFVTIYSKDDSGSEFIDRCWEWAKQNNFLKGEAFSLTGGFLGRDGTKMSDVYLTDENEDVLQRSINRLSDKDMDSRGLIFMGPPGTGKTLACKAIKNETDVTYIWVSARDFWKTGAVNGICTAFDMAKELAPAVVVYEDVDNWISSHAIDLMKTEMDGVGENKGVMTILTTNYPELIPPELIDRPGRFHDICEFHLPDAKVRMVMLKQWLEDLDGKEALDAVDQTKGYSGAHMYELCKYANVLKKEDEHITLGGALLKAITKIDSQRTLIDDAQLVGSRYRPNRREFMPLTKSYEDYELMLRERTMPIEEDLSYEDHMAIILMGDTKQLVALRGKINAMLEVTQLDEKAVQYREFVGAMS